MIIAFTWKPRAGKMLICIYLLLAFVRSLMGLAFYMINILGHGIGAKYVNIYSLFVGLIHMAAVILLLCFVIVSRNNYASENQPGDS
jgi:hypothetical protein